MSAIQQLRAILKSHGFLVASRELDERDIPNLAKALAQWTKYPRCMAIYPTKLTKKVLPDAQTRE